MTGTSLIEVLRDLLLEEAHAGGQLFHAVDAILDADPAVEANRVELAEDDVVVIQALADLAVTQTLGVALNATLFVAAQVFDGAFDQVAVAGVHGNHAVLHPTQ